MIYRELGWDTSIFSCNNGTVRLTMLLPEIVVRYKTTTTMVNNWSGNNSRSKIYTD
jgi:hypothetical protein